MVAVSADPAPDTACAPSFAPQEQLHRFTHAFHEVFAFSRSKKPMIQRQLGRLKPTPSLKYRADEVMRNLPIFPT
jgi:hypothetical protein